MIPLFWKLVRMAIVCSHPLRFAYCCKMQKMLDIIAGEDDQLAGERGGRGLMIAAFFLARYGAIKYGEGRYNKLADIQAPLLDELNNHYMLQVLPISTHVATVLLSSLYLYPSYISLVMVLACLKVRCTECQPRHRQ